MTDSRAWPPELSPDRAGQIRSVVMAEVTAAPGVRVRRRRLLTVVAAVVAVLLAGAGTATALLHYAQPDDPSQGYCSPSATLERSVWEGFGFGSVQGPDGSPEPLQALDACRAMWDAGIVTSPDLPDGPPVLTACVIDGDLVVMPGDARVCARLGVPAVVPTTSAGAPPTGAGS